MADGGFYVGRDGRRCHRGGERRHDRQTPARRAIARLQQVEAPILGTVLNRSQLKDEGDHSDGYERPHTPPALADEPCGVAPSDERVS